jgi:hypothetical protein
MAAISIFYPAYLNPPMDRYNYEYQTYRPQLFTEAGTRYVVLLLEALQHLGPEFTYYELMCACNLSPHFHPDYHVHPNLEYAATEYLVELGFLTLFSTATARVDYIFEKVPRQKWWGLSYYDS